MTAVSTIAGARATSAASHGRRRTVSAVHTTVTTRQTRSRITVQSKNRIDRVWELPSVPVSQDASCMKAPVSTGYSSAGPRPSPVCR